MTLDRLLNLWCTSPLQTSSQCPCNWQSSGFKSVLFVDTEILTLWRRAVKKASKQKHASERVSARPKEKKRGLDGNGITWKAPSLVWLLQLVYWILFISHLHGNSIHICSEKRNILRQLVQVDRGEEVSDALPVSHAHNAALLIVREGHRGTESNKTALRGGLGGGESGGHRRALLCRLRLKLGEIINSTTAVSVFWNDTGVWMRRHRWGRKWSNHPKISKQSWSWA